MLTSSERHAVGILAVVIVLLAAFHIGVVLFVPDAGAVPYAADLADGTLVTHTGTVDNSLITKTGGHLILNVSGVDIFVPGGGSKLRFLKGDRVEVRGIVETYAGKKEIMVNDADDVTLC